jgi:hypothetical protein
MGWPEYELDSVYVMDEKKTFKTKAKEAVENGAAKIKEVVPISGG